MPISDADSRGSHRSCHLRRLRLARRRSGGAGERLFWLGWGFDASSRPAFSSSFLGSGRRTVSSFNIVLWLGILAGLAGILAAASLRSRVARVPRWGCSAPRDSGVAGSIVLPGRPDPAAALELRRIPEGTMGVSRRLAILALPLLLHVGCNDLLTSEPRRPAGVAGGADRPDRARGRHRASHGDLPRTVRRRDGLLPHRALLRHPQHRLRRGGLRSLRAERRRGRRRRRPLRGLLRDAHRRAAHLPGSADLIGG